MIRFFVGFLTLAIFGAASEGVACPPFLKQLQSPALQATPRAQINAESLCELHDQYQSVLGELEKIFPGAADRIRAVYGPRFIRRSDFFGAKGASQNFDPWKIYEPRPSTWARWEAAAELVRVRALENYLVGSSGVSEGLAPFTDELLGQIHGAALAGLPNFTTTIRDHGECGVALYRASAMPVHAVTDLRLVRWHPTTCYEDMSLAERHLSNARRVSELREQPTRTFWVEQGRNGKQTRQQLQCGWYEYLAPTEIRAQLNIWAEEMNRQTATWYSSQPVGDPIRVAARAQRTLISIHPFRDGNGRTSRFVMDYLLTSLGLPAPLLENMDLDMASTETEWATQVAAGMRRHISMLHGCKVYLAQNPNHPMCIPTARTP